jgi:hypothetical protein
VNIDGDGAMGRGLAARIGGGRRYHARRGPAAGWVGKAPKVSFAHVPALIRAEEMAVP